MQIINTVNVLGTEYQIIQESNGERSSNSESIDYDGFVDFTEKKIYIADISHENGYMYKQLDTYKDRVIRHEIIHAFLFESGLDINSDWARNEELVDWIAIQLPKIADVINKLSEE